MLLCDYVVSLKDFKILASSNAEFHFEDQRKSFNIVWQTWIKYEWDVFATLLIWLMHFSLNTLFVLGLNIITIVLFFHCNF